MGFNKILQGAAMKLPRFFTELTEKQARHKALNPSKWLAGYVCEACGRDSASCGKIETKQWLIIAYRKCPACEASKAESNPNNALKVAKERALKIFAGGGK